MADLEPIPDTLASSNIEDRRQPTDMPDERYTADKVWALNLRNKVRRGLSDQPVGLLSQEQQSTQEADVAAAGKMQRSARGRQGVAPENLPHPNSPEEFDKILPGTQWVDPEGKVQTKPYTPRSADDYRMVPEGAKWIDPEGKVQSKPNFESLPGFANTLYNMASNDAERRHILEKFGPEGEIKADISGDLYVENEGKFYKARGITRAPISSAIGQLAPTVGAVAGEAGGGALGGIPGAIAGAGVGGAIGQGFNDIFLKLFGVYDRSFGEEAGDLALSGAVASGGSVLGRLAGGTAASARVTGKLSPAGAVANWWGVDPEGLELRMAMKAKGLEYAPPTVYAKEAPYPAMIVDVFDPKFHQVGLQREGPTRLSMKEYFEKQSKEIMQLTGKTEPIESLVYPQPSAAIPTKEAGEKIIARAQARVAETNARLNEMLEARQAGIVGKKADVKTLQAAEKDARKAATDFINAGYKSIEEDISEGYKRAEVGRSSGDLWRKIADKFVALRKAASIDAQRQYGRWERQFGEIAVPESTRLAEDAQNFLAMLPEELQGQYPGLVRLLTKLGGIMGEDGQWVKEPTTMNLQELHDLRSIFRFGINWRDLRSDVMNGSKKLFEGKVNEMIKEVPEAHRSLSEIDKWYKETFDIFGDRRLQAIMDGIESGEPADPRAMFDVLIKEGRSDLNRQIEKMVGPALWNGVKAADAEDLMRGALTETPGSYDGNAFIRGVLDRHRSGMLESIHGREVADKWLEQVRNLKLLGGKLELPVQPGERVPDVIARVQKAVEDIRIAKETDPLALLNKELQGMRQQAKAFKNEPLGFLYNPTMGAEEAVDKILSKPDLILAAERMFGRDSEEFRMLQQIYTENFLRGGADLKKRLAQISKETQNAVWPGATQEMIHTLADEFEALLGATAIEDTGTGMAATSRVTTPTSGLPVVKHLSWFGGDSISRSLKSNFYLGVREMVNSQWFLNMLKRGVASRDPAVREETKAAIRETFRKYMRRGGSFGAGVAEAKHQQNQSDIQ